MDVAHRLPTRGQIQRELSQSIQRLYKDCLGHTSGKISCQLFDEKLTIVIENSITQPERLIVEEGDAELAEKVRSDLNSAFCPRLSEEVSSVLGVDVSDVLSDATLETGRMAIVVVLERSPQVRESKR